jgi:hypothetical protein
MREVFRLFFRLISKVKNIVYIVYICGMRKLIDLPDDIAKDLKVLAVLADKDLKNYIQDILIEHAKKNRIKKSK